MLESIALAEQFEQIPALEQKRGSSCDTSSNLDMLYYSNLIWQEYARLYYKGWEEITFKEFADSVWKFSKVIDYYKY